MLPSSLLGFIAFLAVCLSFVRATDSSDLFDPQSDVTPDGSLFYYLHPLPHLAAALKKKKIRLGFNCTIADHFINFCFHRESDTLLVIPRLSSVTGDQITVLLVGFKQPYEEGLETSFLPSATAPLITRTALRLGSIRDAKALIRNNPFTYLFVKIKIEHDGNIGHTQKPCESINTLGIDDLSSPADLPELDSPLMTSTQVIAHSESSSSSSSSSSISDSSNLQISQKDNDHDESTSRVHIATKGTSYKAKRTKHSGRRKTRSVEPASMKAKRNQTPRSAKRIRNIPTSYTTENIRNGTHRESGDFSKDPRNPEKSMKRGKYDEINEFCEKTKKADF